MNNTFIPPQSYLLSSQSRFFNKQTDLSPTPDSNLARNTDTYKDQFRLDPSHPPIKMYRRPLQTIAEEEEGYRAIAGPAIQATPQGFPGHANHHFGLPFLQPVFPIDPQLHTTSTNTPEYIDYSRPYYLNHGLYVEPPGFSSLYHPSGVLPQDDHFNEVYEISALASTAAALSAAGERPGSMLEPLPMPRLFRGLITTPAHEHSDADMSAMREADELDHRPNSDGDISSSDWWSDHNEPASASASGLARPAVIAPTPHLALRFNTMRLEGSALNYTPPASPVDREMLLAPPPLPRFRPLRAAPTRIPPLPLFPWGQDSDSSSSAPPPPPQRRYPTLRIRTTEDEETNGISSSSVMSEHSTTPSDESGADAVEAETTTEEPQSATKPEVKGKAVDRKARRKKLPTSAPASASEPTAKRTVRSKPRTRLTPS